MKNSRTMPLMVLLLLLFKDINFGYAQQYRATTEVQSTFIDITGLFGGNEPASITQFSYIKNGFGLDLYHGFSLQNFGKTIQSIATPSYLFKLDNLGKFSIKTKVEIANLEASGGGFVRPGIHFIYKPNDNHTLNFGTWTFSDMRNKEDYPKRLNGHTFMVSYIHAQELKKWRLTQETRVLYVDIAHTLKVAGLFQNLQFTFKPIKLYFGGNAVYSFYRSVGNKQLFWNATLGKYF
jgi:hypothetical protein